MSFITDNWEAELATKTQNDWAEYVAPPDVAGTYKGGFRPNQFFRRFDHKGNRFYWSVNGEEIQVAAGITSLLSEVMGENKHLVNWKLTTPNWEKVLEDSATYGTIMHAVLTQWLTDRTVDNNWFSRVAQKWGFKKSDQLHKDLHAFMKWVEDYNVKPLLIEAICACRPYADGAQLCSAVDSVCLLTLKDKTKVEVPTGEYYKTGEKKGQPKYETKVLEEGREVHAIVDYKSNFLEKESKSFYDSHKYQLYFQRRAIRDTLGIEIDHLFNWSPDAWRKEPSYTFKRHDLDKVMMDNLASYLLIGHRKGLFKPKGNIRVFPGEYTYNTSHSDYESYCYEEFVRKFLINQ